MATRGDGTALRSVGMASATTTVRGAGGARGGDGDGGDAMAQQRHGAQGRRRRDGARRDDRTARGVAVEPTGRRWHTAR
ncbi:hypothetical protein OsI_08437 [Oryza sativa Indica Group]|uniref:Uncharacterized protein n=1 Tax=Oryza sativa subsp. indica TaxID=39946 RepID=A2X878_ORYSI|nr:hypothetical protein OsI_08437 [Oryza sativa Indica Group]